jgi:hypothetical protein
MALPEMETEISINERNYLYVSPTRIADITPVLYRRKTASIVNRFVDKIREYLRRQHPQLFITSHRFDIRGRIRVLITIVFDDNPIMQRLVFSVGNIEDEARGLLRTECTVVPSTIGMARTHVRSGALPPRTRYVDNLLNWLRLPIRELCDDLYISARHPAILAFNHARNTGHHLANNTPVYPPNENMGVSGAGAGGAGNTTGGKRIHRRKQGRRTRRTKHN